MSPGWEFVADEMPAGGGGVRSDRGRFMSRLSSLFGGSGRSAA
jgi:hypothetical protein